MRQGLGSGVELRSECLGSGMGWGLSEGGGLKEWDMGLWADVSFIVWGRALGVEDAGLFLAWLFLVSLPLWLLEG